MLSTLKRWIAGEHPDKQDHALYRSRFGGLWTDRSDASLLLEQKLSRGDISQDMAERIRFWMDNGYVIIEGAVSHDVIDQVNAEIDAAWETKDERFRIQTGHGKYIQLSEADRAMPLVKLLDFYAFSKAAQKLMFADAIREFLNTIFEDDVLAFQNLTFEMGSTQAIHQDTAYVVCSKPMELAASWVALEDIVEGSGELQYYSGSHRLPEFNFGDTSRKHWDDTKDGQEAHTRFLKYLHETAQQMNLPLQTFRPKKGDALIWSADLAHGGGAITKPNQSRKSFVTHYCPNTVDPHYFSYAPQHRGKKSFGNGSYYSSSHYLIGNHEKYK